MARIKFILSFLFLILSILCIWVFYFRNAVVVPVDLIFVKVENLEVGFWILSSFGIGAVFGILAVWPVEIFWRFSRASKDKKLRESNKELAKVKSSLPKGS